MVFVKYSSDIKAICMRWLLEVKTVDSINSALGCTIHPHSCAQWKMLYVKTCNVVRCGKKNCLTFRVYHAMSVSYC
ncbi:hypothetical protein VP01_1392g3 [Puccinia sorghi]|uniref:Uncharacterized protein n=1 Tax=Puccinia sorghi TaxID=27349 RepID=A0A0L6VN15_9BASI|nr:hypothetical protein VP01_1392g3 [Puccinia sorghi]